MKYEKPTIKIATFQIENIVTSSSLTRNLAENEAANDLSGLGVSLENVISLHW